MNLTKEFLEHRLRQFYGNTGARAGEKCATYGCAELARFGGYCDHCARLILAEKEMTQ